MLWEFLVLVVVIWITNWLSISGLQSEIAKMFEVQRQVHQEQLDKAQKEIERLLKNR